MKLVELARTVRSKNAGPLKLTLDLLFDDEAAYRRVLQSPALEPGSVARLYGRREGTVEVLPHPAALAIKIVVGFVMAIFWFVVVIAAVVAVLWALKTIL